MSFKSTLIEQGLQPDIIDEPIDTADEYKAYMCFLKNGDTTRCMIKRIWRQNGSTETKVMYPNGYADYVHNWEDREVLNYSHRRD